MSALVATQITAAATAVLALFAIVTGVFAVLAFRKQSAEVATLQQQATDQQELTRQQGEMLRVQADQLDLQRRQLDDQCKVNGKQIGVLELQAQELQASLTARQEATVQWRYQYASTVVPWQEEPRQSGLGFLVVAHVKNTGERPVRDMSARWHVADTPIQDREQLAACFLPGAEDSFECRVEGAAIQAGLKAIVQFRTVGDDWWSAGTDGGLIGGMEVADLPLSELER